MKRVIEYSDVFSFDFGCTDNIRRDINDLKERLSDELEHFLELGFSDAFLFVMSETHNDGEVKVYAKSFGINLNPDSLQSIQDFSVQVVKSLNCSNNYELELVYHLSAKDVVFPNFNQVFETYTSYETLKEYIYHIACYPSTFADCFVREELSKFVTLTPKSDYIIKCQCGHYFECKLVNEEDLILPDFDENMGDEFIEDDYMDLSC